MIRRKRAVLAAACIILGAAAAAAVIWPDWFTGSQGAIVVYCAHDSVFADAILKEFERQTGIPINVVYDSEATKSLGLVNQLKLEKDDPHCDVFWNNELLGTMDLASEGVLEPYKGAGYERIPAQYKDDAGRWTGFAARMRVWIVNTKQVAAEPDRAEPDRGGRVVRKEHRAGGDRQAAVRHDAHALQPAVAALGGRALEEMGCRCPPPRTAGPRRQRPRQGRRRGGGVRRRLDRHGRLF